MRLINIFIIILLVLPLPACSTIFLASALVTAANVFPHQERTFGNIIDDKTLWLRLKKEFFYTQGLERVSIMVSEGRVLLTGRVEKSFDRILATKVAWNVFGVEEVMNELLVQNNEPSYIESTWITTQIKTAILLKSSVRSFNYSIETFEGTVFLMGIAYTKAELQKVIDITRKTPGVRKIISYVRLKDSILREKNNYESRVSG